MKPISDRIVAMVAAVAIAAGCMGCSAVGFYLGYSQDENTPDVKKLSYEEVTQLSSGTTVSIVRTDGDTLVGKYSHLVEIPLEEYLRTYTQIREHENLPAHGEIVYWQPRFAKAMIAEQFLGFEHDAIILRKGDSSKERSVPFKTIAQLRLSESRVFTGKELGSYVRHRKLPLRTELVLVRKEGEIRTPYYNFDHAEIPKLKIAKWVGLATGIAIDAAIVRSAKKSMQVIGDFQLW